MVTLQRDSYFVTTFHQSQPTNTATPPNGAGGNATEMAYVHQRHTACKGCHTTHFEPLVFLFLLSVMEIEQYNESFFFGLKK